MFRNFFFIFLLDPLFVFSKTFKEAENIQKIPIHQILSNYQKRDSVTMEVVKILKQPVLKREIRSKGKFYFSNKLWRFDVFEPHPSVLFYDGAKVTYFANNVLHHTPQNGQRMILSALLDQADFNNAFTYQGVQRKGRTQIYAFSGKPPSPQKLFVQVEKDRILSLRIQWDSSLGEEYYRFRSIHFDQKLSKKLFQEP